MRPLAFVLCLFSAVVCASPEIQFSDYRDTLAEQSLICRDKDLMVNLAYLAGERDEAKYRRQVMTHLNTGACRLTVNDRVIVADSFTWLDTPVGRMVMIRMKYEDEQFWCFLDATHGLSQYAARFDEAAMSYVSGFPK